MSAEPELYAKHLAAAEARSSVEAQQQAKLLETARLTATVQQAVAQLTIAVSDFITHTPNPPNYPLLAATTTRALVQDAVQKSPLLLAMLRDR